MVRGEVGVTQLEILAPAGPEPAQEGATGQPEPGWVLTPWPRACPLGGGRPALASVFWGGLSEKSHLSVSHYGHGGS